MKKSNIAGCLLVFIALVAIFIGVNNSNNVLSKSKVYEIVNSYIKANGISTIGTEPITEITINQDLYRKMLGTQQWIVLINDQEVTWMFIDAYSGRITSTEERELESFYILPTDISSFEEKFSWFMALNYIMVTFCTFRFYTNRNCRKALYISLTHLIGSLLLFEVVSFIYMWIVILFLLAVDNIYSNFSSS